MAENIIKNPFVGCTARDMHFDEVVEYWCSPFNLYNLNESELFLSKTPIIIEGIRGSGKTMILKYLSYKVQREFIQDKSVVGKLNYLRQRSFGTYFRYKEDFCNLFSNLRCTYELKERIFKQFFELFILREMVDNINDIYDGRAPKEVVDAISSVINVKTKTLKEIDEEINHLIKNLDITINKSNYTGGWEDEIIPMLESDNLINTLVKTLTNTVSDWNNILFSVILDEYENLDELQPFVNTLLKQVDESCNLTYRLGMRPAGMEKNNTTRVGSEKLQVDRDYILRRLVFKSTTDYKKFAIEVSYKRLCSIDVFSQNNLVDICKLLGNSEDIDAEANEVAKGKKHFALIEKTVPEDEFEKAKELLSNDEKLLEMYNILLVSRGRMPYETVSKICSEYVKLRSEKKLIEAKGEVRKYKFGYSDKYRLALLFLLRAIYGEKKWYYSFNTFLYLSSGSINDFISLCRNTFKYLNSDMLDELVDGRKISVAIQSYGARDTAEDQLNKVAQSNHHGSEMYSFVDNLGGVFEEYHRDMEVKYPETNQFAFTNENLIRNDPVWSVYLIELINSGAILRKQNRQRKSLGQPRGNIYQINRIFAPIYQFSYRTRGGYNQMITFELFQKMLRESVPPAMFYGKEYEKKMEKQKQDEEDELQLSIYDVVGGKTIDDDL